MSFTYKSYVSNLIFIGFHLANLIYGAIDLNCRRDPKSCLSPETVERIGSLSQHLFYDEDNLPYWCFLLFPNTVPVQTSCVLCSDENAGCPSDHNRGENWEIVCAFYCPPITTTTMRSSIITASQKTKEEASSNLTVGFVAIDKISSNITELVMNIAKAHNATNTTEYRLKQNHNSFPIAVWVQLAFPIVFDLGAIAISVYVACCCCPSKIHKIKNACKICHFLLESITNIFRHT